jgi:hypothetical protein
MWDSVLGMFGQSAEQAARRDMDDYTTAGKGGLKPREGAEVLGDFLRGGSGAVNKAAREIYVESLQDKYGDDLADFSKDKPVDITATTKEGALRRQVRDAQADYARDQKTKTYNADPGIQRLIQKEDDALAYQKGRDTAANRRADQAMLETINARRDQTALGMAQLDISRQQEANRMLEETRRYDQRRADSKKERMAALIAGLTQLGGAFTI